MCTRRRAVLAAWAGAWLAGTAAVAQPGRVPVVTRLVRLFLDKEQALLEAQRQADAATLAALLSPDFELRSARQPATPVARAEWLAALPATRWPSGPMLIEQMSAHEHPGLVIVSFRLRPERDADLKTMPALFIVDTWVGHGEQWLLATRYASSAQAVAVPGDAALAAPTSLKK